MDAQTWLILVVSYLIGSIPNAILVTRWTHHADIEHLGDRNIGAKNVFVSVGPAAGLLVGALDILKGALAVLLARHFTTNDNIIMLAGACAILGHDFSIFVHFHGGQGLATTAGVFLILFPQGTLLAGGALALTVVLTRNWDLACFVGVSLFFIQLLIAGQPLKRVIYAAILLPLHGLRKLMQLWATRHQPA